MNEKKQWERREEGRKGRRTEKHVIKSLQKNFLPLLFISIYFFSTELWQNHILALSSAGSKAKKIPMN